MGEAGAATFSPFAMSAADADADADADVDAEAASASNTLIDQLLPGHKIARGRGRRKQLEKMTEAEKKAEKEARMEKMRVSARECRLRKKHNIATLRQSWSSTKQRT